MKFFSIAAISAVAVLSGCASIEMASDAEQLKAKEFAAPSAGNAGLYVYRNSLVGAALRKDLWVDGNCLGESGPDVFFYTEVAGNKTHKIETESEFSPNALEMKFETGKHHFVRQVIKMGAFVGGAKLEQMPEAQGKVDVAKLSMAKNGKCDSTR